MKSCREPDRKKDFGDLKECVLICFGAVVIAVFNGICSSFTLRYFHYTKQEKHKELCGQGVTQYKYRLRNKGTNKYKLRQDMKKAGISEGEKP